MGRGRPLRRLAREARSTAGSSPALGLLAPARISTKPALNWSRWVNVGQGRGTSTSRTSLPSPPRVCLPDPGPRIGDAKGEEPRVLTVGGTQAPWEEQL